MKLLVTLLSAVAFGLHILLGCCAHHAHAATGDSCRWESSGAQHAAKHDHHHGHSHNHHCPESQSPEDSERGHQHDDCHESHCTFIAADETILIVDVPIAALPSVAADASTAQATAISLRWLADTGDPLRLPVRLHLYHQVLLI